MPLFNRYINNFSKEPSKTNNSSQFAIHEFESFLKQVPGKEEILFLAGSCSILWVHHGSGKVHIDMEKFTIEDDSLYYLKPGSAIALDVNEDAEGYLISLSREFLELYEKKSSELIHSSFFNYFMNLPVIKIDPEMRGFRATIADEMLQEF